MWYQSLLGLAVLPALAWLFSENKRRLPWRPLAVGLAIQLATVLIILNAPAVGRFFGLLTKGVILLQEATTAGTTFVFGFLGGGAPPYETINPANSFVFAFQALPLILLMSALSALLYHWRILPAVVQAISRFLEKTMGIGGATGVSLGANVFMGMVEAPLLVRPYLAKLSRSEMFTLMTGGMATVAGTVMALYAAFLKTAIPDSLGHILLASLISAPAAVAIAQIMIPHQGPVTAGRVRGQKYTGPMDAITQGTAAGVKVLINVAAMTIVLLALVFLVNALIGLIPGPGGVGMTLQKLMGWLMAPICWLLGVPWSEAFTAGELMGTKTILNELLAYLDLSRLPAGALSERSRMIMVYALCGFANLGSLGIMIGGLTALVPERRAEITGLGVRSLISGTLATCMTGAAIGLLY